MDSFLQRLAPEQRSSGLISLLRIEVQARRERGEEASEEEYRQRYPEASDAIDLAFTTRGQAGVNTQAEVEWSVVTPAPQPIDVTHLDPNQRRDSLEAESPWKPGMMLGNYRLEERLDRGGFGEVWKGWDTNLHSAVAIKLLLPKWLNTCYDREFFKEAQKLRALHQQGAQVVLVLAADTCDGWPYIVSQFLAGGNLQQRMLARPRDWQEALRVVAELANTLKFAHANQVYHRDIKPKNVLLDEKGQVYLADFGLAVSQDELVQEGFSTAGTWAYSAPEQALLGIVEGRSDIYSLGVILYEWLTGRWPGPADRNLHLDWLRQTAFRAPAIRELNDAVPEPLQQICLEMLEKDYTKRNITAGDVARRLKAVLELPKSPDLQNKPSLPRWLLPLAASVAFALVVGGLTLPAIVRSHQTAARPSDDAETQSRPAERSPSGTSAESETSPEALPGRLLIAEGSAAHRRKWQSGLSVPPGLLRFQHRREEQRFSVVADGQWLLLKSTFPQLIPFAFTAERNLRQVTWRMRADEFDGWGFFYNWRESPSGKVEFGGLLFYMTYPEDGLPQIWAHQTLFGVDELQGTVSPIRPFWQQELFVGLPPPQDFEISLRFQAGELTTLVIDGQAVNVAMNPENHVAIGPVRAPFGFVLRKGGVELMSPQLEFEP